MEEGGVGGAAAPESAEVPAPPPPAAGIPAWRDGRVLLAALCGAVLGFLALHGMSAAVPRTTTGTWNAILFGGIPGGLGGACLWKRAGVRILRSGPPGLLLRLLQAPALPRTSPTFPGTFLLWAAFCAPVLYATGILATLAHEVAGHGLTALLFGGWFRGFVVNPWGGGFALCGAPGFESEVSAAGMAAEAVVGLLLLLAAGRRAPGGPCRVGLLLGTMASFTELCVRLSLGGLFLSEGSDLARILEAREATHLGGLLASMGATGFVAALWTIGRCLLREADLALRGDIPIRGWRRLLAAQLFVAFPGTWWVVPAIGAGALEWSDPVESWTLAAASLSCGIAGVALCLLPRRERTGAPGVPPGARSLLVAWSLAIGVHLCARFWWGDVSRLFG